MFHHTNSVVVRRSEAFRFVLSHVLAAFAFFHYSAIITRTFCLACGFFVFVCPPCVLLSSFFVVLGDS